MMKRMSILLLVFLMWTSFAYAQEQTMSEAAGKADSINFEEFSTDELIEFRGKIEEELIRRGVVSYFDLEMNSKGDDVAKLQSRLAELGYYVGNITGRYDSATRQAEKQFEKHNGLENDGVASQADQQVLYSDFALAKVTPAPQSTKMPKQKEQEELKINPEEYGPLDYEDVMRYPENHRGEKVKLDGKVVQVLGSRNTGFQVRFSISGSSDVVYVYISGVDYNILENDRMTIYAVIKGIKTYTSILNQSITIPSLQADCAILKN